MLEFTTPNHVTADYLGEPGNRTFYVQAEQEGDRVSAVVEKAQVASLAEALVELLARVDLVPAIDYDAKVMELRAPLGTSWRAGQLGVGLDPEQRRMALEVTEFVEDEEREPEQLRVWLDPQVARRLASHCQATVGQGRPRVEPSTNGHGPAVR